MRGNGIPVLVLSIEEQEFEKVIDSFDHIFMADNHDGFAFGIIAGDAVSQEEL